MHPEATANLLRSRRTIHLFRPDPPARELVDEAIALACWAPNHRLTEPWRFCWVGPETWQAIAELNAQLVSEKRGKDAAAAKLKRWLAVPGVVLVTCIRSEDPVRDEEDYAATACAVHNMALFLWSHGVGTKWSSRVTDPLDHLVPTPCFIAFLTSTLRLNALLGSSGMGILTRSQPHNVSRSKLYIVLCRNRSARIEG